MIAVHVTHHDLSVVHECNPRLPRYGVAEAISVTRVLNGHPCQWTHLSPMVVVARTVSRNVGAQTLDILGQHKACLRTKTDEGERSLRAISVYRGGAMRIASQR